jgi:Ser/Thr protein kinase RdoA (MazF antagonist)
VIATPDAPYAALDPGAVLDSLDALGLQGDGRILALNSYENRVYQVHLEGGRVVVAKFYRPARWSDAQILEEHAFARELAAADVPVVPPLELRVDDHRGEGVRLVGDPPTLAHLHDAALRRDAALRVAVAERRAGRAPNLEDPQVLRWLGRFVGRLHTIGEHQRFEHRRSLDVATWGHRARGVVESSPWVDEASLAPWLAACDAALARVQRAFDAAAPLRSLRLHGDLHPGNILWRELDDDAQGGPHIVDLDDACNGPAIQDLWMLLSGDATTMRQQLHELLEGYRLFRNFDDREAALIEPLRTLRMIHHSAWIAERWRDPAFPAAFPWFATPGYWAQQATQLREQVEAMDKAVD